MFAFVQSFLLAHPEYQKKFSQFADVPNFLVQSYTILAGLNGVINAMGNKDNLFKEIYHLGWTHFNRGVTTAMFGVLNEKQYLIFGY